MRRVAEILAGFLALPEADVFAILNGRRALILAPHPDDESLGCGGLIAAACAAGLVPLVVVLTDGAASHPGSAAYPPARLRALREAETARAAACLGLPEDRLQFLRQPDGALPGAGAAFDAVVALAAGLGRAAGCRLVIGPWGGDPHCDHEAGAAIAAAVAARTGWQLLSYPVWGWLRDGDGRLDEARRGGWRLNISDQLERKQRAISAHESQYGGVITDAPDGFTLPAALLAVFARPFEVFIT
jgi:LmbE family N-acetylglucosaminyl deacetylase